MTRKLHQQDVCEVTDNDLQTEITRHLTGDVLALAVEDSRLQSLVPIAGQTTLFGDHLDFGETSDLYAAPLYDPNNEQAAYFPRNKNERFHYGTNSYDTIVTLFPKCGYFQRPPPFMDMTRIVRPGGTLVAVTGLQPESPDDHDAKWWVPASDDVDLDTIRILRSGGFKTPILVNVFTVTTSTERHPEAAVVTGPADRREEVQA